MYSLKPQVTGVETSPLCGFFVKYVYFISSGGLASVKQMLIIASLSTNPPALAICLFLTSGVVEHGVTIELFSFGK